MPAFWSHSRHIFLARLGPRLFSLVVFPLDLLTSPVMKTWVPSATKRAALTNGGIVGSCFAVVEVEQTSKELCWNQAAEREVSRRSICVLKNLLFFPCRLIQRRSAEIFRTPGKMVGSGACLVLLSAESICPMR
jgi:hypothetical protein